MYISTPGEDECVSPWNGLFVSMELSESACLYPGSLD